MNVSIKLITNEIGGHIVEKDCEKEKRKTTTTTNTKQ